jgi:hypothetical protein
MAQTAQEKDGERRSPTVPREQDVGTQNELIDCAREALDLSRSYGIPADEQARLWRVAHALLSAVLGKTDNRSRGDWQRLGAVAGSVVARISHD